MAKGKFGVNLTALAILGFILCFFGFTEVLVLLIAYALILEKDEWLTRQTFQALFLRIAYSVALTVVGWLDSIFGTFFGWVKWYGGANAMASIHNFLDFVLYIALFVLAAIAIIKLLKNRDAGLPVLGHLADYTMGIIETPIKKQTAAQTPVQPAYQAPAQPQATAATAAPVAAPVAAAPAGPVAAAPAGQPADQSQGPSDAYIAFARAPAKSAYQQPPTPAAAPAQAAAAPVSAPVMPVAPAAEPGFKTAVPPVDLPAAFNTVPEPAVPAAPVKAAPAEGYWICSCGRENWGNFCISCGNPRKA